MHLPAKPCNPCYNLVITRVFNCSRKLFLVHFSQNQMHFLVSSAESLKVEKNSIFLEKKPFSAPFFRLRRFAGNNDRILADQLNFLPRNYIIFAFSEYSKEEKSCKYYKSYNTCGFCIHNYVIDVTKPCAVHSADYLLAPEVSETTIHTCPSHYRNMSRGREVFIDFCMRI